MFYFSVTKGILNKTENSVFTGSNPACSPVLGQVAAFTRSVPRLPASWGLSRKGSPLGSRFNPSHFCHCHRLGDDRTREPAFLSHAETALTPLRSDSAGPPELPEGGFGGSDEGSHLPVTCWSFLLVNLTRMNQAHCKDVWKRSLPRTNFRGSDF